MMTEKPGRTKSAANTRLAILASAKHHFAKSSYEETGMRAIAADAGCDVALIGRYFGSKEALFTAVVEQVMRPEPLFEGDRATFGLRIAEGLMRDDLPDLTHDGEPSAGLESVFMIIRAATSHSALPVLRAIGQESFAEPFAEWLGGNDAELRANLIATAMFGASLSRLTNIRIRQSKKFRKTHADILAQWIQALVDDRGWRTPLR